MQNCLELPGEENKQANKYKKNFCGGWVSDFVVDLYLWNQNKSI